jgi:hypothetical protein
VPEPVTGGTASADPAAIASLGYGDDAAADQLEAATAELDRRALNALRLIGIREAAERALKAAQEAEREELEVKIPEVMQRLRMKKCATISGIEVVLRQEIKAALPGRERVGDYAAAIAWLVDEGHGGVVKNEIKVELDRGEDTRADALIALLRADGFEVDARKYVHPGTLSALVKELLEAGKIIPTDVINVHDRKVVKLVRRDL